MELLKTLPADWYVNPEIFERERRPIFASSWVQIGYEHEVARPGDHLTENVAGWPVFVRRGEDGTLRGFYNLCPHRAGPLVWEGSNHSANLVCRYHGWAFGSDGTLLSARDFGCPAPDGMDLVPIQVGTWKGMLFVCLDPAAAPLVDWFAQVPAALAAVPLETYRFHSRSVRHLACNWKTYADNFLEGYHVPTVHPAMSRDADALKYQVAIGEDPRWHLHVMPARDESVFGVFGWMWPTFAFDILPDGFAVERWLPRGHTHTDLIFEYFFAPDTDPAEIERIVEISEEVADEDGRVCEHVQRNLDAGLYSTGVLSPKWEYPLAAFQRMVRQAVGVNA